MALRLNAAVVGGTFDPQPQAADPIEAELIDKGRAAHRLGRLGEAERYYRQVLAHAPDHPSALHLLGVLHHQGGRHEAAIELISRATRLDPGQGDYHSNLSCVLADAGRLGEALAAAETAIALAPDSADAHYNRGLALQRLGRLESALSAYETALGRRPDMIGALNNRGAVLEGLGRLAAALAAYDEVLRRHPEFAEGHLNRGCILVRMKRLPEAAAAFETAQRIRPDFVEALKNLRGVYDDMGLADAALRAQEAVCRLAPQDAEAQMDRGVLLGRLGRLADSLTALDEAVRLRPGSPETHFNRGVTLQDLGRLEEALGAYEVSRRLNPRAIDAAFNAGQVLAAIGCFEEALYTLEATEKLAPDLPGILANKVAVLRALGRIEEAHAVCEQATAAHPNFAGLRFERAILRLSEGDYPRGWEDLESRWEVAPKLLSPRGFPEPQWRGEDIFGKTILLHAEQGWGDTLQFCRYATMVAARGARVILEAPQPLVRLLGSLEGVDQIVTAGAALPDFDVHCPLLSLPLAFGTTLSAIPGRQPYLQPDPMLARAWRERLGPRRRLRVGLFWAGNPLNWLINRRRDIPLDALAPLAGLDVDFVSLQVGSGHADLRRVAQANWGGPNIQDPTGLLTDFAETAALVANLDLVVSVDSAVVHLAGALGKPVWVLNRFDACWRWLRNHETSPWYPTARIFGQPRSGDWASVIADVRSAMEVSRV